MTLGKYKSLRVWTLLMPLFSWIQATSKKTFFLCFLAHTEALSSKLAAICATSRRLQSCKLQ